MSASPSVATLQVFSTRADMLPDFLREIGSCLGLYSWPVQRLEAAWAERLEAIAKLDTAREELRAISALGTTARRRQETGPARRRATLVHKRATAASAAATANALALHAFVATHDSAAASEAVNAVTEAFSGVAPEPAWWAYARMSMVVTALATVMFAVGGDIGDSSEDANWARPGITVLADAILSAQPERDGRR